MNNSLQLTTGNAWLNSQLHVPKKENNCVFCHACTHPNKCETRSMRFFIVMHVNKVQTENLSLRNVCYAWHALTKSNKQITGISMLCMQTGPHNNAPTQIRKPNNAVSFSFLATLIDNLILFNIFKKTLTCNRLNNSHSTFVRFAQVSNLHDAGQVLSTTLQLHGARHR